ncbi:hypothetical protein NM688_g2318 [Phlebia brevispora]|uniref:Uncharacterized protein n=1 Tax=Phlebia brevispora TaxID=194682 RepID=A0ACC1T934_9APHY|nr:hypothetical protein NM688_g2318 [Phlebia brevispora]
MSFPNVEEHHHLHHPPPYVAAMYASIFPFELYDEVIGYVDIDHLSKLSLVNTYFRFRTQAILFKDIRIVAGPLCILRSTETTVGDEKKQGRILPDTFQEVLTRFEELSLDALNHVRSVTLGGLSSSEKLTNGHGLDLHLNICMVKKFLSRLRHVETLQIHDILWSPCMKQLLDLNNHNCVPESVVFPLKALSLSHVAHSRSSDTIFNIFDIAGRCEELLLNHISWRNTPPFGLSVRTPRQDVQRLVVRFPDSFSLAHQLMLRFPILTGLTYLEVHNVAEESYDALWNLLEQNSSTLEELKLNVDSTSFSVDSWIELPTFTCSQLREVSITLDLCNHKANDGCAGTETLEAFLQTLSESVEVLHVAVMDSAMHEESVRRFRSLLDWSAIIAQLKTLPRLKNVDFIIVNIDDMNESDSVQLTWENNVQKDLRPINVVFSTISNRNYTPGLI